MKLSKTGKRVMIAAIFVAEVALLFAVAYGAGDLPTESVIVGEDEVIIEVGDQRVWGAFSVARVVTPVDGWVIVRADAGDGLPAELIGAAPVSAGESRNVAIAADTSRDLPRGAFVSVVADRGTRGEFEYTTGSPDDTFSLGGDGGGGMMAVATDEAPVMTNPMDWLLASGGQPVMEYFEITPFNVVYRLTEANIGSAFLEASGRSARILAVDAPDDSWVVIIRVGRGDGDQNEVIGSAQVPAGHTEQLSVPVGEFKAGSEISALLVADLGEPGLLEIDAVDPPRSIDAPYIVRSWFVWKRVAAAY
jgi:hypothetical protein